MAKLISVLLEVFRTTLAELITQANAVFAGLNTNPAYPDPPVPLLQLRKMIDDLSAAMTAALDGGAKAIAQRNALGEELRGMLHKLARHVEIHCKNDMTTFLSSGFQPRPTARPRPHPVSGAIRKIGPGKDSGQIQFALVGVPSAVSYELRWSPVSSGGSPGEWNSQLVPNTRPWTISGLTPGTAYAFQARALTRSGDISSWSESVTRICT